MPNWFNVAGSILGRLPIERWLVKPRDPGESLEKLNAILTTSDSESRKQARPPANPPSNSSEARDIATGCLPCALGHFGTCSGLLNEAMRFARKDGLNSNEVIDRVNMCLDELNAMERVDLRPELIANLPQEEKGIANRALSESRGLRHQLEGMSSVEELEQSAAQTQTTRKEIGRAWFNYRQSGVGSQPKGLSLDEAMKIAAEEAVKKVEDQWQQEPPDADLPGDTPVRQQAQQLANRVRSGELSRSEAVEMLADDLAKDTK